MQRREHEVAGHRGLRRDLRRLAVTDLAHEDHVGVLAQKRTQRVREGDAALWIHLDLRDPRQLVLDRILDRRDVHLARRDLTNGRVQRGCLS